MALSFDVNYLAVVVSAIVGMVIGALWYGPLFGKKWIALMKFTDKDMKKAKEKGMAKSYAIGFLVVLVFAFVLALFVDAAGAITMADGAIIGFWLWLGFLATTMLNSVVWEGKPVELYVLNAGHYLVVLLIMGAILAVWV